MKTHLLGAEKLWDGLPFDDFQGAGWQAVVDGVEHQKGVRILHVVNEIQTLRAAIEHLQVVWQLEGFGKPFRRTNAKTLVRP